MSSATVSYPAERMVDVVLRDGSTVAVRPVRPDDAPAIFDFLERLSPGSLMFRFFSLGSDLHKAAKLAARVDYVDAYGLVALVDGRVVGHACYARMTHDEAEIAFATADELQGHGLATILLTLLAETAAENDISTFVAHVMPANHRMIDVFSDSGFPVERRNAPGEVTVELRTRVSAVERGAGNRGLVAVVSAADERSVPSDDRLSTQTEGRDNDPHRLRRLG